MINCFKCSKGTTFAFIYIEHHKCYIVLNVQGPCGTNNTLNLNHIEKIQMCFKLFSIYHSLIPSFKVSYLIKIPKQKSSLNSKLLAKKTQVYISYSSKVCHYDSEYSNLHTNHTLNI
jgi:hypothetical protein